MGKVYLRTELSNSNSIVPINGIYIYIYIYMSSYAQNQYWKYFSSALLCKKIIMLSFLYTKGIILGLIGVRKWKN